MRLSLAVLPFLLALSACNPANRGPTVGDVPGNPVGLTSAQAETVKASVRSYMGDSGGAARFGTIVASRIGNGPTTVCGFVSRPSPSGTGSAQAPFEGTLYEGQGFVTNEVGRQSGTAAAITSVCRSKGVQI